MYFWNDKKLAADLRDDLISERQQLPYLLIPFVIMSWLLTSVAGILMYADIEITRYALINDALYVVMTAIFIIISFKINQKNDGQNFISRYMCLSFPIVIKFIVVLLLLGFVGAFLDDPDFFNSETDDVSTGIFTTIAVLLSYLFMLWRYVTCFKIASTPKESE